MVSCHLEVNETIDGPPLKYNPTHVTASENTCKQKPLYVHQVRPVDVPILATLCIEGTATKRAPSSVTSIQEIHGFVLAL